MAIRPSVINTAQLVDKYINTAYDNILLVSNYLEEISTVASLATDLPTLVEDFPIIITNIDAISNVSTNITAINAVYSDLVNINIVAGIQEELATIVETSTDIVNFIALYQGSKNTEPTVRNDSSALQAGDLYFNTVTASMYTYSGSSWVSSSLGINTVVSFSGDGITVDFELPITPPSIANTFVYLKGVYQNKDTYSIAGTTLTFTEAPMEGTDNIEIIIVSSASLLNLDSTNVSHTPSGGSLTTVADSLNSITADINNLKYLTINTQASSAYTLQLSDSNSYIRTTSASAATITVPSNSSVAFFIGTIIHFRQSGSGQVSFIGASGVTLFYNETLKTRKEGSVVSIIKVDTDSWELFGDVEAAA